MKKPDLNTRLLGSTPMEAISAGMLLFFGYEWTQHGEAGWLTIFSFFMAAAVGRASGQVRAWKAWKLEWDAMAGIPPRRTNWRALAHAVMGLALIVLLIGINAHGGTSAVIGVLILLFGALLVLGILRGLWRVVTRRKRRRATRIRPVMVCIKRPLLPARSLQAAYQGLPPYCQDLLRGQS